MKIRENMVFAQERDPEMRRGEWVREEQGKWTEIHLEWYFRYVHGWIQDDYTKWKLCRIKTNHPEQSTGEKEDSHSLPETIN